MYGHERMTGMSQMRHMLDTRDGWAWVCEGYERNPTRSMGGYERTRGMSQMRHMLDAHDWWAQLCGGHERNASHARLGGH